jgi:hypothetical protein
MSWLAAGLGCAGAVIVVILLLLLVGASEEREERDKELARQAERDREAELYRHASANLVTAMPDEDAIRAHERLVEQSQGMIDELYDFGERIAQHRRDQGRD